MTEAAATPPTGLVSTGALTRRSFLGLTGTAAAAAAAVAAGAVAGPLSAARPAAAAGQSPRLQPAVPVTPGVLVLVTLYGGNDGLNMLIPLDAGPYLAG